MVDEANFAVIEDLKRRGDFEKALALIDDALKCPMDEDSLRRCLINLIVCAANLKLDERAREAMTEMEKLPKSPVWDIAKNLAIASLHVQYGRYQEAFDSLKKNLEIGLLGDADYVMERYETLSEIGIALTHIGRYSEAFIFLEEAQALDPNGCYRVMVKVELSACLRKLGRLDEAYTEVEDVVETGDRDMAAFALYRMANIRLQQGRCHEALHLYRKLGAMLPSALVAKKDVELGIVEALKAITPAASREQ